MTDEMTTATVYSRPHCVRCTTTIRALTHCGVVVQVRQLDDHPDKIKAMQQRGWQELPLVEVHDAHGDLVDTWCGFSQAHIDQLKEN